MDRATVPKTPVHEDGKLNFREDEVWLPKHRAVSTPPSQIISPEEIYQGKLGIPVALSTDTRHYFRSLRLRKNIRHTFVLS
jgi:hypothetical protein